MLIDFTSQMDKISYEYHHPEVSYNYSLELTTMVTYHDKMILLDSGIYIFHAQKE